MIKKLELIRPFDIIDSEFLEPCDISYADFATMFDLTMDEVNALATGELHITKELACMLSAKFSTTIEFWLNLQSDWEMQMCVHDITEAITAKYSKYRVVPNTMPKVMHRNGKELATIRHDDFINACAELATDHIVKHKMQGKDINITLPTMPQPVDIKINIKEELQ